MPGQDTLPRCTHSLKRRSKWRLSICCLNLTKLVTRSRPSALPNEQLLILQMKLPLQKTRAYILFHESDPAAIQRPVPFSTGLSNPFQTMGHESKYIRA